MGAVLCTREIFSAATSPPVWWQNFYVATRSAGLLDAYEEQISQVSNGKPARMSFFPVLDEPTGDPPPETSPP